MFPRRSLCSASRLPLFVRKLAAADVTNKELKSENEHFAAKVEALKIGGGAAQTSASAQASERRVSYPSDPAFNAENIVYSNLDSEQSGLDTVRGMQDWLCVCYFHLCVTPSCQFAVLAWHSVL